MREKTIQLDETDWRIIRALRENARATFTEIGRAVGLTSPAARERVRRMEEAFPGREGYRVVAFGDSRGDREMLAFADEAHYKPFR